MTTQAVGTMDGTTLMKAMEARHSVRQYLSKPIPAEVRAKLKAVIDDVNKKGGLHLVAAFDDPAAFSGMMAHYGKFSGVENYVVCAGKSADDLQERVGFYGEQVVLEAQALGLNTCWVAMTYGKGACRKHLAAGEKLVCVLAIGYGSTQGVARKSKPTAELGGAGEGQAAPAWFEAGLKAAQLAPTAMNQQKFRFELQPAASGATPAVSAKSLGGFYSKIDLGIARRHFEIGANEVSTEWRWA